MKHHNEIRGIEDLEKRFTGNASENLSDLCELLRIESASQIKFTMSAFQVGNNKKVKVDEKTCDMAVILYALSYTFPTEEKDTNFLSFLFRGEKAEGVIQMCLCFDDEICQEVIASAGKKIRTFSRF